MNSTGNLYRITSWGESHGPAMGVVIDGCPANIPLNPNEIQKYLAENDRPLSELATGRIEPNSVRILSGLYKNRTLGTPISILIKNENVKKSDYSNVSHKYRPGHGEYSYYLKYDHSYLTGGGRASGRECISRLASGYIAEKIIKTAYPDFCINTHVLMLAGQKIDNCQAYEKAVERCLHIAKKGDSSGGVISLVIKNIPTGIGEPVFNGLDAQLTSALMSIGAVRAVEIGSGKQSAYAIGSEFNDDFTDNIDQAPFVSNHHGGIISGISTGADIVLKLYIKPTPSIEKIKNGISGEGEIKPISVKGRHDKNITPRIGPIASAMAAIIIVNALMTSGKISKDRIL